MGLIRLSRRTVARWALRHVLKNREAFAERLAAAVNLPALDEEQEKRTFKLLLEASLTGLVSLLGNGGSPGTIPLSKRALVVEAVAIAAEVADELGESIDVPGIPDAWESFAGDWFAEFLTGPVTEWAQATPLLD